LLDSTPQSIEVPKGLENEHGEEGISLKGLINRNEGFGLGILTRIRKVVEDKTNELIKEMGDFPVGQHDDVSDAFCHGMKSFITARDFKTDLPVMPGHLQSEFERRQELFEEWQCENDTRIGGDFGHDF
jgi:hypothetical protein